MYTGRGSGYVYCETTKSSAPAKFCFKARYRLNLAGKARLALGHITTTKRDSFVVSREPLAFSYILPSLTLINGQI